MKKQIEIILGIILSIASTLLIVWFAFKEEARMEMYSLNQAAERIEIGGFLFDQNCTHCHGKNAIGTNMAPCLNCEDFFTNRSEAMKWEGSLEEYLIYTVSNGRAVSSRPDQFPGDGNSVMPIWSEQYGGPLREDQIRAIAAFILNYEAYALGFVATPESMDPLESLASDPIARGKYVFQTNKCIDCHDISNISDGGDAPPLNGIAARAVDMIEGYTAEEYIRESILFPAAYKVEIEKDLTMPPRFGEILTESQINDLIIFLLTLDE